MLDHVAPSQLWDPCVSGFVRAQPEPSRRAWTAALSRYQTRCDAGDRVVLQLARGLDGRARRGTSDIGFSGTLAAGAIEVSLRVAACGPPLGADRVALVAGATRWSSPRLAFVRDQGCDVAELPLTRALARLVRELTETEASGALVVFEGRRSVELVITDEMKQDLAILLDAIEATELVTAP